MWSRYEDRMNDRSGKDVFARQKASPSHSFRRNIVLVVLGLSAFVLYMREDGLRISPFSHRHTRVDKVYDFDKANAAPRIDAHAIPITATSGLTEENSCRPFAKRTSSRYALPSDHPRPAIGEQLYGDSETCTTYSGRYAVYDDVAPDGYLREYYERIHAEDRASDLRFANEGERGFFRWAEAIDACDRRIGKAKRALVLRSYENYTWGHDDVRNVRALISELALTTDVERRHDVFLLVEVHTQNVSFSMSDEQRLRILQTSVPREFWGITKLWSEEEMAWLYPGLSGKFLNHMSPTSSYRSCFMPLQAFARQHGQYEFIWNWEMDTRSTHDYASVLRDVERFAFAAPTDDVLERQSRWHVLSTPERTTDQEAREADLITLNPIFNVDDSGSFWAYDFQNMPADTMKRGSIGRNVRFSRRLLQAMTKANVDEKVSTHCEYFPGTILVREQRKEMLTSSWKGVYVPHPIYTTHVWDANELDKAVNRPDIYKKVNEKVLRDVSFYYDGGHAKIMYEAWRNDSLVCHAPSLLHPVKRQF